MSAEFFLDTNVLIYAFSEQDALKKIRSRDCILTFELWLHMIQKQLVILDDKEYAEEWQNFRRKLKISSRDLQILVGQSNPVSYMSWTRKSDIRKTFLPFAEYCSYTH